MLRPKDLIDWYKARSAKGQGELLQLLDGLLVGGQIVIGGSEQNVARAHSVMAGRARMGRVVPIKSAVLDVDSPTTFDTPAVVQLVMIAQNEAFHSTVNSSIGLIDKAVTDGATVEEALVILRQTADTVLKL